MSQNQYSLAPPMSPRSISGKQCSLSVATVLLIVAGFLVGTLFTQKCHMVLSEEADDNLIANTWVGVTLLAGSSVGDLARTAHWRRGSGRRSAACRDRNLSGEKHNTGRLAGDYTAEAIKAGVVLALVLIGVTLNIIIRDTSHTDTGLYHLPQMVWMSLTGLVPGLGLLHHRFGYNSTWLALVAPFFDLLGGARLTALGGSLVFSLLILHGLFAALRDPYRNLARMRLVSGLCSSARRSRGPSCPPWPRPARICRFSRWPSWSGGCC